MTIYRIRMWVNQRVTRGREKGQLNLVAKQDKIVVDNLDYARAVYREMKAELDTWEGVSRYSGKVELFIPHIHPNGPLAYWPYNDQYIDQWEIGQ